MSFIKHPPLPLANPPNGLLSQVEMAARGLLRCLGPGEILRGRLRFS